MCSLVPVKSAGDRDLVNPIYDIGIQGVFTKELDVALLNDHADAAVHSFKDIPTALAMGLHVAAVMERGPHEDVLFVKPGFAPAETETATIATSSIRRKAQWLERYRAHTIVNVRGNVETRLRKFWDSEWNAMIVAKAGVERLGVDLKNTSSLPWMIPSPAQGAIAIVCRVDDAETAEAVQPLHHEPTHQCTFIERDFLKHLHGGCSVPISAFARMENDQIHFAGAVHSMDGKQSFKLDRVYRKNQWREAGELAAEEVKTSSDGRRIVDEIQKWKIKK